MELMFPLKAKSCNLKATSGFTIIELLVVIAIIGLLSSIVLVSLNEAKWKAKVAAAKTNTLSLRTEMELLVDPVDGTYPASFCTVNGFGAFLNPGCNSNSFPLCVGSVRTKLAPQGSSPQLGPALQNLVDLSKAVENNLVGGGLFSNGPEYLHCWTGERDANEKIKEWAIWFVIKQNYVSFCIDSRGVGLVKDKNAVGYSLLQVQDKDYRADCICHDSDGCPAVPWPP